MQERLTRALAALTTGIYVLTTRDGQRAHGMSSSWVTQVSGEPPLIAVAVDRRHLTHDLLLRSRRFALNVVGQNSRALEDYFYSPQAQRPDNLDLVAHEIHVSGMPVLSGVATALICGIEARYDAGDHSLFVASILDVVSRAAADRPLTSQELEYAYVGELVRR